MKLAYDQARQGPNHRRCAKQEIGNGNGGGNSLTVSGGSFSSADINNLIASAGQAGGQGGQLIALNGGQAQVYDAIPEPASLAVLGAGLLGLGFVRRRRA